MNQITVCGLLPIADTHRTSRGSPTGCWDTATLAAAKYLGTDGSDYLGGTDDSELFEVGSSDDMVMAAGGDDIVNGGAGNDHAYGDSR
jgi:Ca2+-binding RTX toxin-like protein